MQPARFQFDLTHCPIGRALELLGERWTLLIVREAIYGVRRFDDFARALGCGRGVLSDRLKRLCEAGVFERRDYLRPGQRPRPEYLLTEKGRDLFPALLALSQWSERWSPPPDGPVALVSERGGGPVEAIITADPYARRLTLRDLDIAPGPGAPRVDAARA